MSFGQKWFSTFEEKAMGMMIEDLPAVINPPTTEVLRKQLQAKLAEYQKRMAGVGKAWEFMHPELAYRTYASYRDSRDKAEVLSAVLAATPEHPVKVLELSENLIKRHDALDPGSFANACGVVTNYLGQTSFGYVNLGTRLPDVGKAM